MERIAPTFRTTLEGIHWILSHPDIRKVLKIRDNDHRVILNGLTTKSEIVDDNTYVIEIDFDYKFIEEDRQATRLDLKVRLQDSERGWELLWFDTTKIE
jgi:hypothetical protein